MMAFMNEKQSKTAEYMEVSMQLDFYGQLLTERMREILDLHYTHDLSLAEIAENLGVSRQAVHDRMRQGIKLLAGYEARLGLVARFRSEKALVQEIIADLEHKRLRTATDKLWQLHDQL